MTKRCKIKFSKAEKTSIWKWQSWNYINAIILWCYSKMQLKSSLWQKLRQPVEVLKSLNDRQSEFRESSEPIMYMIILQYVNWEVSSDPKTFFSIMSIIISRIAVRSWHQGHDILPIERDACSWREILSIRKWFLPGGGLPEKLGRGVWPASESPYPIYDQNLHFSLPYLWPNQKFDTLFMTWLLDH